MSRRTRIAGISLTIAAVGLFAAACGGSSSGKTPAAAGTPSGNTQFAAYISCMKSNGVTINVPTARPSGGRTGFPTARPSNFPTARPSFSRGAGGGFGGGGGGFGGGFLQKPADVDQATWDKAQAACASVLPSFGGGGRGGGDNGAAAAYRNCLSNHGVTDFASPDAAAAAACAVLKPTASPAG